MKFTSTLVLALAGLVAAKGDKNSTSTKSQCKQVEKLTRLSEIAGNQTLLDKVTDGNATKASAIQAKASDAATKLSTLQANTTLMTACDSIFAEQKTLQSCGQMAGLEKLIKIAGNQTLLDKHTDGNATKASAIQAKASEAATKLTDLQSNSTLTAACAVQNDKQTCKSVAKFAKQQAKASNTTYLNAKFDNNATKVAAFQAKMSAQADKMATLMSNTTLASTCESLGINVTSAATTDSTSSSKSSSDKASAGVTVSALAGGQIVALVSVFAYAIAML